MKMVLHFAAHVTVKKELLKMGVEFINRDGVPLYKHQADVGDEFENHFKENGGKGTFTIVIPPNGGKTLASVYCMHLARKHFSIDTFIVAAPSLLIRNDWPKEATIFDVKLSKEVSNRSIVQRKFSDDQLDGFAVTYQSIAKFPELYRKLAHDQNTCVVFDEIHHLGENLSWGEGCLEAFEYADIKICLSGTPFRTDGQTIPFLEYEQ